MPDFLRFQRLGFSCNPFRVLTNEEWAILSVIPSPILDIIDNTNHHLQLIGDIGRGKTTLLLGIYSHFQQCGVDASYEYIPEGQRHFKTRQLPDVFLLDEVQRLTWRERRRLFKQVAQGARLIFSTHRDMQNGFQRRGLALEIIDVKSLYDGQILLEMWQRRLDHFRTGDSPVCLTTDGVEFLLDVFRNDRRSMERFLYEAFQVLETPQPLNRAYLSDFRKPIRSEQA
ncbi:MAG: hypothetical protein L0154_11630 [Chloroflexi bacterium]|nr:hypothetical protein [Chloroflexota bacterium]